MAAVATLALLLGQALHELACAGLNEPAGQVEHVVPMGLDVPGVHAVQDSDAPLPLTAKPAEQVHVAAPASLVLPVGHGVHDVALPRLNVLGLQAAHDSESPLSLP